MWIIFGVQMFVILLFFILGWVIRSKQAYWLISGFANRPKEEQQQLIENGYPQKSGLLLQVTAVGMLLLLPLIFTSFKYAIEVQYGFMLVFLLGGAIYLSKYELPKKRKRSYIISTSLFVVTNALVIGLMFLGYQDYQLISQNDRIEITGVYGDKWKTGDIQQVELMEQMPKVTMRQNGFGLPTMAKGKFKVSGYGSCLLFIRKDSSPYLYIKLKDQKIFINGENPEQTKEWYQELSTKKE